MFSVRTHDFLCALAKAFPANYTRPEVILIILALVIILFGFAFGKKYTKTIICPSYAITTHPNKTLIHQFSVDHININHTLISHKKILKQSWIRHTILSKNLSNSTKTKISITSNNSSSYPVYPTVVQNICARNTYYTYFQSWIPNKKVILY